MRKLILFILAIMNLGVYFHVHAQEKIDMVEILGIEKDIGKLEKKITRLLKNRPETADMKGLQQFHIFQLSPTPEQNARGQYFTKEEYRNKSFLFHFSADSYRSMPKFIKSRFLQTLTYVTDSMGNVVADGNAWAISPYFKGAYLGLATEQLIKMLYDKKLDFACFLAGHNGKYWLGIKDNRLYAFQFTEEGLKIYTWEEFMNCCFDKWILTH